MNCYEYPQTQHRIARWIGRWKYYILICDHTMAPPSDTDHTPIKCFHFSALSRPRPAIITGLTRTTHWAQTKLGQAAEMKYDFPVRFRKHIWRLEGILSRECFIFRETNRIMLDWKTIYKTSRISKLICCQCLLVWSNTISMIWNLY